MSQCCLLHLVVQCNKSNNTDNAECNIRNNIGKTWNFPKGFCISKLMIAEPLWDFGNAIKSNENTDKR